MRGTIFIKAFGTIQITDSLCIALCFVTMLDSIKLLCRRPPRNTCPLVLVYEVFAKAIEVLLRRFFCHVRLIVDIITASTGCKHLDTCRNVYVRQFPRGAFTLSCLCPKTMVYTGANPPSPSLKGPSYGKPPAKCFRRVRRSFNAVPYLVPHPVGLASTISFTPHTSSSPHSPFLQQLCQLLPVLCFPHLLCNVSKWLW